MNFFHRLEMLNLNNEKYYGIKYHNKSIEKIRDFAEDAEGRVWICAGEGLFYYDLEEKELHFYNAEYPAFREKDLFSIAIDHKNNIWIGTTNNGVFVIQSATKNVYKVTETKNYWIENIFEDKLKNIWICTSNNDLIKLNSTDSILTRIIINAKDPYTKRIRGIESDKNENVWFGTRGGLYFKPLKTDQFTLIGHTDLELSPLTNN